MSEMISSALATCLLLRGYRSLEECTYNVCRRIDKNMQKLLDHFGRCVRPY